MNELSPGQRVVCIDGNFHPTVWEWANEVPIEGRVYTVSCYYPRRQHPITGKIGPGVSLVEISGRIPGADRFTTWAAERFRPLDTHEAISASSRIQPRPKKKRSPTPRRATPSHHPQPATSA